MRYFTKHLTSNELELIKSLELFLTPVQDGLLISDASLDISPNISQNQLNKLLGYKCPGTDIGRMKQARLKVFESTTKTPIQLETCSYATYGANQQNIDTHYQKFTLRLNSLFGPTYQFVYHVNGRPPVIIKDRSRLRKYHKMELKQKIKQKKKRRRV